MPEAETLKLKTASGRKLKLNRIQGGTFSSQSPRLYLISDTGSSPGGIYAFNAETGRCLEHHPIDYIHRLQIQELEGATVIDLDRGPAPGIAGQLHVVMISNAGVNDDDLYFKHFEVDEEKRDWPGKIPLPATIESQALYVGNRRSKEVHLPQCGRGRSMLPTNRVRFTALRDALDEKYNGCWYCLRRFDTG